MTAVASSWIRTAPRAVISALRLAYLSSRWGGGRWRWVLPFLPVLWPLWLMLLQIFGEGSTYTPERIQSVIHFPLILYAIALGSRVIAQEVDRRTIEIAYTVPGGAQRIWIAKLLAALFWLLIAEAALIAVVWVFLSVVPLVAIYGALQAAVFYLLVATGLGAVTRSEITGILASIAVFAFLMIITGFDSQPVRISPTFNPLRLADADSADVLAWTFQNRVFMLLCYAGLLALSFSRAERREKMLAG